MFDADRPISKKEQDRLNRAVFAQYLARCLLDHKDAQSLVVGLYGGFGSGKTSLLNLILEELNFASTNIEEAEQQPIILNFSPWSYSGQEQLIYSFFRRLSFALRQAPPLKNAAKIVHLLELYISFFTHKPVPKAFRPKQALLKQWRNREDAYGWESGRDLTQVKAELNEELRKQSQKIIIIIDNISRLYDEEIKQMFQIIKSMGDYANTIYLLALDKEQVTQAIDRLEGGRGEELLEKIVQLSFDVPLISRQDIESILLDKLQLVMPYVSEGDWNSTEWAEVYYSSLRYFFETCRDLTRYVNALSFSYPRVKEVVNAVDFFALTALEVFMPEVYAGIRENKDLFTDLIEGVYPDESEKLRRDLLRLEEIVDRGKCVPRETLLRLLMYLFPRIRKMVEPEAGFYYSDVEARKHRRISCADMFEAYFRLSMQSGYISEEEMAAILSMTEDEESFTETLRRLNQDQRIVKFLDLLDTTALSKIPNKSIGPIISALLDNGDLFPEEEISALRLNTPMRIYRIIHQLLLRYAAADERFSLLRHAILKASKSINIIVHEVRGLEQEADEEKGLPEAFRVVKPEQLLVLQKLAVDRILFWVQMGRLSEHPRLLSILEAWHAWGDPAGCQDYVQKMTLEDRGLLAFLGAIFKEPIELAVKKHERTVLWEESFKKISEFIAPKWLEPHAKAMFEDLAFERLREREQLALLIFLSVMGTDTSKLIPKTI